MKEKWGNVEVFKKTFNNIALKTFGSGWVWLVKKPDGSLDIIATSNFLTPLTIEDVPLLTCDVWGHHLLHRLPNARAKYLENFWNIVDWKNVEKDTIAFNKKHDRIHN